MCDVTCQHGECDIDTGTCECYGVWRGDACDDDSATTSPLGITIRVLLGYQLAVPLLACFCIARRYLELKRDVQVRDRISVLAWRRQLPRHRPTAITWAWMWMIPACLPWFIMEVLNPGLDYSRPESLRVAEAVLNWVVSTPSFMMVQFSIVWSWRRAIGILNSNSRNDRSFFYFYTISNILLSFGLCVLEILKISHWLIMFTVGSWIGISTAVILLHYSRILISLFSDIPEATDVENASMMSLKCMRRFQREYVCSFILTMLVFSSFSALKDIDPYLVYFASSFPFLVMYIVIIRYLLDVERQRLRRRKRFRVTAVTGPVLATVTSGSMMTASEVLLRRASQSPSTSTAALPRPPARVWSARVRNDEAAGTPLQQLHQLHQQQKPRQGCDDGQDDAGDDAGADGDDPIC